MPHQLLEILGWAGMLAGLFVFFIAFTVYRATKGQLSQGLRLEVLDPDIPACRDFLTVTGPYDDWCERNGFAWIGAYSLAIPNNPQGLIGAWQNQPQRTYFCVYRVGPNPKVIVDIVSEFDGDRGVTTCNSSGAMLFPSRAGRYKQALVSEDLDFLWRSHQEGVRTVQSRFGLTLERNERPFEQLFVESIRKVAASVCARPLWPLRAVFWFFTQSRRINRPIAQQELRPPQ
jgi:hypothetical protein